MNRVALIDSGLSNLDSARRAIEECGGTVEAAREPRDLKGADRVVLPGVGAFPDAMQRLRDAGLDKGVFELAEDGRTPILGICLGMQLLASSSTEVAPTEGIGVVAGEVVALAPKNGERIPHIGWNEVSAVGDNPLFEGLPTGADFYFVHSFHVLPHEDTDLAATTPYAGGFASAIGHDLVWGVQFHPEKSQKNGFTVLRNFLEL